MCMKRIAIVTGATGGIGYQFARLLVHEGVDEIWALGRSYLRLSALKSKLGDKIVEYPLDLTSEHDINDFAKRLSKADVQVIYLVNCAGFAKFGSYSDISDVDHRSMIDVNIKGLVMMTMACLPYMPKGSHIINMSSQAGFQPLPYMNLYSATKAFVRYYSRALNVELKSKGVSVTAVCPGWVSTDFINRAKTDAKKTVAYFPYMTTPFVVAKAALRAAQHNKDMSICGWHIRFDHFLSKILPQKMAMNIWMRQQRLR